jgi:predicted ATPase
VDLLGQLVSKSLVMFSESRGEAHYRLLDTIREYAHEKLQKAGEGTWLHSRYRWWRWRNRVRQHANTRQPGREDGQDGQQEAPD